MKRDIRIKIQSSLYEVEESLFSFDPEESDKNIFDEENLAKAVEPEVLSINTVGVLSDDGERISVSYTEPDGSGMDGAQTTISFLKAEPGVVTMSRTGLFAVTFVFEASKRYQCLYNTPYAPFSVCIHTKEVQNGIESYSHDLWLDYVVEIRGAAAERTKFKMQILY